MDSVTATGSVTSPELLLEALHAEMPARIARTQARMRRDGLDALLVFGNNKVVGSLAYLTGFSADRAGWISLAPDRTYLAEGGLLVLPSEGTPTLIVDAGLTLNRSTPIERVVLGGFTATEASGITPANIVAALGDGGRARIGIETWDRFPAPLYLGLREALPAVRIEQSRIVEELRLVKSPAELAVLRSAAAVADVAHAVVVDLLQGSGALTELELIRAAEDAMRRANPIYEDGCSNSPSMISSGTAVCDVLIHAPQPGKQIRTGDIVHWDLCMRHLGYGIDTARSRCVGEPTAEQQAAYDAVLEVYRTVVDGARPGTTSAELVALAVGSARDLGYPLWGGFLGHGLGIDVHERPDMGVEDIPLQEGMVLALEPRIQVGDRHLVGNEDLVVVGANGGVPLMSFPKTPFGTGTATT